MKPATEQQSEARAVEDAAWDHKVAAADIVGRALSEADCTTLASVQRDLARLLERVVEVRDRRRRKRSNGATEAAAEEPAP
jgi:hypothetical protein